MTYNEILKLKHSLNKTSHGTYSCSKCNIIIYRVSKNIYINNNTYDMYELPTCAEKIMNEALI